MILNCDIGERGMDHPVDRELMSWIGLANIACGGHAGDADSVRAFCQLAEDHGVEVSAHLSYPDRKHFGRMSMSLSSRDLADALEEQWQRMPDAGTVKFHGALYNDAWRDVELAGWLAGWLLGHGVNRVVCPPDSELALACGDAGVEVLAEAFVERRYVRTAQGVQLVPRSDPLASISEIAPALDQARDLIQRGGVRDLDGTFQSLQVETLCIHSDAPLALELAQGVHALLEDGV